MQQNGVAEARTVELVTLVLSATRNRGSTCQSDRGQSAIPITTVAHLQQHGKRRIELADAVVYGVARRCRHRSRNCQTARRSSDSVCCKRGNIPTRLERN